MGLLTEYNLIWFFVGFAWGSVLALIYKDIMEKRQEELRRKLQLLAKDNQNNRSSTFRRYGGGGHVTKK